MIRTLAALGCGAAAIVYAFAAHADQPETLRQVAQRKGVAVGAMILDTTWQTPQQQALVAAEFNAATVGTFWKRTHPEPGLYNWSVTDAAVQWAKGAGLGIHLHPLLYPSDSQNPQWVLDSDPADAPAILADHIATAAQRYRGVADVWDVVNEPVAPSPQGGYRDTWWLRAMGPAYVVEAFRLARQHDPDAILLLNETDIELSNAYQSGKWATTQQILQTLHAEGLVDGLGWQLHTTPGEVFGSDFVLAERMQWVRDELGLKNFVTELDMEIGPGQAALTQQGEAYRRVADIWLAHSGGGWLQTWGVYDLHSWLGDGKRPLLFDEQYRPKPAYDGVIDALNAVPDATPGDFNGDGAADAADFDAWRGQFGGAATPAGLGPDGNGDAWVNAADFVLWRDSATAPDAPAVVVAVPEPAGWVLVVLAAGARSRGR